MSQHLTSPAIDLALARAGVYRWFSKAFREPSGLDSSDSLRRALAELPGLEQAAVPDVEPSRLASEYRRLFSHNLTPDCPPYETQYGSTHIFWQSQQLADIAGFYRAFGVKLSQAVHERVDHLAVELEFMGYLALKEAHALERHHPTTCRLAAKRQPSARQPMGRLWRRDRWWGHDAQMTVVQDAQRTFLNEHLGRWVGAFSSRVQAKLPGGAYARLVETLDGFVAWNCQRLGIQPEPLLFNEQAQRQQPFEDGCMPTAPCGTLGQAGLPCGGHGGPP